jgi:hypothetical protein
MSSASSSWGAPALIIAGVISTEPTTAPLVSRSRYRRQATDETSSREVGFYVEHPTGAGRSCLVYTKPEPTLSEIGARLALTRRALSLTRFKMARLLGTDMPTLGNLRSRSAAHPGRSGPQALPLWHPAGLGLPGGRWPTCTRTSPPKLASSQVKGERGKVGRRCGANIDLGKQGGLADLTPESGRGHRDGTQGHRQQTRRLNVGATVGFVKRVGPAQKPRRK